MEHLNCNGDEYTLGLHFEYHDTGAAIVDSKGKIIAAINEERLTRQKEEERPPFNSIKCLLEMTGLSGGDISRIAVSGSAPGFKKDIVKLKRHAVQSFYGFPHVFNYYLLGHKQPKYKEQPHRGMNLAEANRKLIKNVKGFRGKVDYVDHHMAHAASAYFTAGIDNVLIVTIDGEGDYLTSRICVGENGKIIPIDETKWPHSPGEFYKLITAMLGFRPRRHAGKITGLAAFGKYDQTYSLVKDMFYSKGLQFRVSKDLYKYKWLYRRTIGLPAPFNKYSPADLSAAFQKRLENVAVEVVKRAMKKTGKTDILLAGGVTANVKMNQRIREIPGVTSLFIHPGMSDCGLGVGAALYSWSKTKFNGKIPKIDNVYFGPSYSDEEIENEIKKFGFDYEYVKNAEKYIAELVAKKKIVGRFDGRMEYGPRALGNRSILADPTDKSINDWLNKRLHRTEFMPFAPSALVEGAHHYYKGYSKDHFTAEFMTITYDVTEKGQKECAAVTHVDNTARPQVVTPEANPSYYKILKEHQKITGLWAFVNTSFNAHEEPIVCSPRDALSSFKDDCVDVLSLGDFIITNHKPKR